MSISLGVPSKGLYTAIAKRRRLLPVNSFQSLESRLMLSSARFAVIGDYGANTPAEAQVAAHIDQWNPDLIITTGDNNYPLGEASTIDVNIGKYYSKYIGDYKGKYGAGSLTPRFFPSLGNHDWYTTGGNPGLPVPYLNYFDLPGNERYYDFVRGPVHFFAVDSDIEPDGRTADSVQAKWCQEKLAASTAPWKVVYFHHSPYSSALHGSDVQTQWPFAQWGASVVLTGHDHVYERIIDPETGFPYIISGAGGNFLYSFPEVVPGSQVRYDGTNGALKVDATDTTLQMQFIEVDGKVIDTYALSKTGPATTIFSEALPTNAFTAETMSDTQVQLVWENAGDETGYLIERSLDGITFGNAVNLAAGVTTLAVGGLAPATMHYFRVTALNAAVATYAVKVAVTLPAGPTVQIVPVSPDMRNTPVSSIQIVFSEAVAGFDLTDLVLARDGAAIALGPAASLTTPNNITFNLIGLSSLTGVPGRYTLRLDAGGTGIKDLANNAIFSGGSEAWIMRTATVAAPGAPNLAAGSDSGASQTDNLTNAATPVFTGSGPAGHTVTLHANGKVIGSGTVAAGGTWSVTASFAALFDGLLAITARLRDPAGNSSDHGSSLTIKLDRTPPVVISKTFNSNQVAVTAHNRVIQMTASEDVAVNAGQLILFNMTTGQLLAGGTAAFAINHTTHVATWTFGNALLDGNHVATLAGGVVDLAGNGLDGNSDGAGGDEHVFLFHQLTGDVNADRAVNHADFLIIKQHMGVNGSAEQGDINGDGKTTFADHQLLSLSFNKSIPAPVFAAAASQSATGKSTKRKSAPVFADKPIRRLIIKRLTV